MTRLRRQRIAFWVVALLLCCVGILWGLPNHWDFAQDSVVPLGQLARMDATGEAVTQYRYPPFHLELLSVLFAPVRWITDATAIGQNEKLSATLFILTARLVSVAMTLGTLGFLIATGRRLWDERTGLMAALLFLLSPATLYYAKNANLDMPYLFWLSACFFLMVRILQENRPRDYVWLGISAALAVCTKDQAYAFLAGILLAMLLAARRKRVKEGESAEGRAAGYRLSWKRLGAGLIAFVVPFVLIHNILFDPGGFVKHVQTIIGPGSEGWREFTPGPAGQLRLLLATLLRLMDAWTVAGVALAVMGFKHVRQAPPRNVSLSGILLPGLIYYVGFVAIIGYIYTRFTLPLLLVLSFTAARGALGLWDAGTSSKAARVAAVVLVGWIGIAGLALDATMSRYSRYDAQQWLETNLTGHTRLYYYGDMRDMPRFNEPLDAKPLTEADRDAAPAEALRRKRVEVLVLSIAPGEPGGVMPWRPSSWIRAALEPVSFGAHGPQQSEGQSFTERLLQGEPAYRKVAGFRSPVAPLVPEVAESVNRTVLIFEKEPTR